MKRRANVIILVIVIILLAFFYDKIGRDETKIEKVVISKSTTINIQRLQLEELQQEKKINREVKESIEYIHISTSDVRIPILMYHSISSNDPDNNLLVPPDMFEEQVNWLEDNGFTAMLLEDLIESINTGIVPKKPVVITFDDGYVDNYLDAYQILKKHRMKATFFIITNNTDKDSSYMSSDMLKEMKSNGMGIENHTSNHLELNTLSKEEQIASIKSGQEFLKNVVGSESKFLCYPVGRYDETTIDVAKELGVQAAVTTEGGISSLSDGIYQLKRIRISPMRLDNFLEIFSEFNE